MLTRRDLMKTPMLLAGATLLSAMPADDWKDADQIQPKDLADRLAKGGTKPMILQVGFERNYRVKRIPGAIYAGPGNKPEGLDSLKRTVASTPKDREIVLYCGCCPWVNCPNMKPAFALLREAGFKNVKALVIETNFGKDWIEKG